MSDPLADHVFGKDAAVDPYDGLPAWMVEDVPLMVRVETKMPNGRAIAEAVQLERDGKLLTKADQLERLTAGDKGDFRWKTTTTGTTSTSRT